MKRLVFAFALLFAIFFRCGAAEGDTVVSLRIDNPVMMVNGIETEIDPGRKTSPVVVEGRTLVPIRAIIEALGGRVVWIEETQTVVLLLEGNQIKLNIGSDSAEINGNVKNLDVAPMVLNGRTMLPLRFVAEGFGMGVAWNGNCNTVTVVKNSFEKEEYERLMKMIPQYSGVSHTKINGNVPFFEEYEIIDGTFEFYGATDKLGRCDVCFASVAKELMPTESRGNISSVKPTGWVSVTYSEIDGDYLYNRCHLIAHQLTGENANPGNLITGTRYMNIEGMLPFENMVCQYVENTGNHVMYRATPVFSGNNLVADGVLLEAYSVEDMGEGICFCVFCYNVQPGVEIDYSTGASSFVGVVFDVYRTPTGSRYHLDSACGGKNSYGVFLADAVNAGLTPCKKCAQ